MADDKDVAAGKRFSRDMRRIREARDVSIDAIHNETRIARTLIQSFEEGGLYEHPTFNRVYLRSFVRAYAQAVDMSPDAALTGLDAALDGTYGNDLAVEYLDAAPRSGEEEERPSSSESTDEGAVDVKDEDADEVSEPPSAGGADGRGGIVGPPREMGTGAESASSESDSDDRETAEGPAPVSDGAESGRSEEADDRPEEPEGASESEEPAEKESGPGLASEESTDSSTESAETEADQDAPSWFEGDAEDVPREGQPETGTMGTGASIDEHGSGGGATAAPGDSGSSGIVGEPTELGSGGSEPPASAESSDAGSAGAERSRQRTRSRGSWFDFNQREILVAGIGMVVVLLVLVGLGFAFFSTDQEREGAEPTAAVDTTTDASQSAESDTSTGEAAPDLPPPANVRLGETMHLTVIGDERVEEIRIQRDDDLRRPYWIEEGEAEVYPFQRRITIENELSEVRLFLERYPYPISETDPNGRITINRSDAEAFVDTLRGTPTELSVTPDTIPKGEPPSQDTLSRGASGG